MKRSETTPNAWTFYDLLLTWYASSQDKRFAELAEFVATERKTHFDAWRDAGRNFFTADVRTDDNIRAVLRDRVDTVITPSKLQNGRE